MGLLLNIIVTLIILAGIIIIFKIESLDLKKINYVRKYLAKTVLSIALIILIYAIWTRNVDLKATLFDILNYLRSQITFIVSHVQEKAQLTIILERIPNSFNAFSAEKGKIEIGEYKWRQQYKIIVSNNSNANLESINLECLFPFLVTEYEINKRKNIVDFLFKENDFRWQFRGSEGSSIEWNGKPKTIAYDMTIHKIEANGSAELIITFDTSPENQDTLMSKLMNLKYYIAGSYYRLVNGERIKKLIYYQIFINDAETLYLGAPTDTLQTMFDVYGGDYGNSPLKITFQDSILIFMDIGQK